MPVSDSVRIPTPQTDAFCNPHDCLARRRQRKIIFSAQRQEARQKAQQQETRPKARNTSKKIAQVSFCALRALQAQTAAKMENGTRGARG
ncbi:MAG: hypothetical protein DBX55_03840 [Verrucomicrobia bacterium]|nr:MAG: hypothetical protein DBX55_03840 [Verrucomicrobiota bacterium]